MVTQGNLTAGTVTVLPQDTSRLRWVRLYQAAAVFFAVSSSASVDERFLTAVMTAAATKPIVT